VAALPEEMLLVEKTLAVGDIQLHLALERYLVARQRFVDVT
jgi:hypothetical protein